jgi:hypothetical protein
MMLSMRCLYGQFSPFLHVSSRIIMC